MFTDIDTINEEHVTSLLFVPKPATTPVGVMIEVSIHFYSNPGEYAANLYAYVHLG